MKFKSNHTEFIDYLFWILFILFTNPGGIIQALGEDVNKSGINVKDFLFVLLVGCFLHAAYKFKVKDDTYKKTVKYLIIFGLYFFIVFGFLVPIYKDSSNYTATSFIIKERHTIYSLLLFIIVYRFYLRSYAIFFKTFIISSIIVLSLFFVTIITGADILPIVKMNRGFINIDRLFLSNFGLLYLLLPIGTILIVFKNKIKLKKIILLSFIMMVFYILLTITRRDILGIFIYLFLALVLFNYFQHRFLFPIKKVLSILLFTVVLGYVISLSFPKYLEAGTLAVEEAVHIIKYGKNKKGRKDNRLGFNRKFIVDIIEQSPFFGTGFDNRWRTGKGDEQGFEAADYPLLSAIAMTGIFGLLFFLPIYIILVRSLLYDIKFIRKNNVNADSFEFYIFVMFILYFIYDLLQYVNWFLPVALSRYYNWYVILAMYFAARNIYYKKVKTQRDLGISH